jgi:hypothetical protein
MKPSTILLKGFNLFVAFEISKSNKKKTGFSVIGNTLKELDDMLCHIDFDKNYWDIVNQHTDEHYEMVTPHNFKRILNDDS